MLCEIPVVDTILLSKKIQSKRRAELANEDYIDTSAPYYTAKSMAQLLKQYRNNPDLLNRLSQTARREVTKLL